MSPPILPVGFDYAQTVLEIRREMTYEQISEACGFPDKQTVARVANGRQVPSHPQGEALWAVYRELYAKNPPMPQANALGVAKVALARRHHRLNSL